MRICHFSDWQGEFRMLPKADIYVCTGDMLPNFPLLKFEVDPRSQEIELWDPNANLLGHERKRKPNGTYVGRIVDPSREASLQVNWITWELRQGGLRRWFYNRDAPVVVCRGNHDFTDLAPAFGGEVYEIGRPEETFDVLGLRFGGCRGINYIVGEWADELKPEQFDTRARRVPKDVEVLVTHAPPLGMMDFYWGSSALRTYVHNRLHDSSVRLKAHLFGHVHEAKGMKTEAGILFSNAATTHNVVEIELGKEASDGEG